MGGHLPQRGKNAADVFIGIDKSDYHRQVASRLDKMRGMNAASPLEARDRMKGDGANNVLLTQILQHFRRATDGDARNHLA